MSQDQELRKHVTISLWNWPYRSFWTTAVYLSKYANLLLISTDDVTIVTLQVYNPHCLSEGKIGDYCDGSQCKAHPLFSTDPYALQIQLYYDDMEVCNPLGSNVKRHKLGKLHYLHAHVVVQQKFATSLYVCHTEQGYFISPWGILILSFDLQCESSSYCVLWKPSISKSMGLMMFWHRSWQILRNLKV